MKKLKFYLIAACILVQTAGSTVVSAADFCDVSFMARKMSNYAPGKLVVSNLYGNEFMCDVDCDVPLRLYDIILSVNGLNVEELSNEELKDIMRNSSRVSLKIISSTDDKEHTFTYTPMNHNLKGVNELLEMKGGSWFWPYAIEIQDNLGIEVYVDEDIDFSQYKTIDVLVVGDNPLKEKEIALMALNRLLKNNPFPLKRDTENPDLLLKVAFNEETTVQSTYVPPTTTYIDRGSHATVQKRKNGLYISTFKRPYERKTTKGYTHRDISADHFLEISILDAKRLIDSTTTTPPIVWQLTYKHIFPYKADYDRYVSTYALRFLEAFPETIMSHKPWYFYSGICWEENTKKSIIADVMEGSPAEKLGLKPGDELIKIDGKKGAKFKRKCYYNGRHQKELDKEHDKEELKFKNQPYYKIVLSAIENAKIYRLYESPYNEFSFDEIEWEPVYWMYGKEVELEIKRNGKKMKIKGALYGETRGPLYGI